MAFACIAVIDDDPPTRTLMRELLTDASYDVVVWSGDEDPVTFVERTKPDLVILDVRLRHQIKSDDVITALCGDESLVSVPVIVCSADTPYLRLNRDVLEDRGCVVVEKPFNIDDLLVAIHRRVSAVNAAD